MQPENKLFATLDVTAHRCKLPCGMTIILVDTVGFISDLPNELLDSFSATLQDILNSVSLRFKQHSSLNETLKLNYAKPIFIRLQKAAFQLSLFCRILFFICVIQVTQNSKRKNLMFLKR